jgi:bifunctional DNase/RNase
MLGAGTQASPFQIVTPSDFDSIRTNLTAHYVLMNNIDLTTYSNFVPIGNSTATQRFKGVLNGNGFLIKNLKVNRNVAYTGLFGFIENAAIKNLGVVDANVNSQSSNYSGIIVGNMLTSTIDQCYTKGFVNGQYGQGGICGWHSGGTISNCWSNASLTSLGRVGGLVGNIVSTTSLINNSYAYGTVSSPQLIGGLIGSLGDAVPKTVVSNSYWNTDIYPTSDAGTGYTTSQFGGSSNFSAWNTNVWGFQSGSYPYLKVFGVPSLPSQKVTVTVNSHSDIANQLLGVSKRSVRVNVSHSETLNSVHALELIKHANVMSHIEQIVSNVSVFKNANIKSYEVTSYLDEFGTEVTRIVTTRRLIQSQVNPIDSIIIVDIPIRIEKPVFAEVFICGNQSDMEYQLNQTNLDYYSNQSTLNQIKNQSNIINIENSTELEVN